MKKPVPVPAAKDTWRHIEIPVWKADLVVYCGPWERFLASLPDEARRGIEPPADRESLATTYTFGGDAFIYSASPIPAPVLVHELLHVAVALLRSRGVDDEEALAYTLEHLYAEAVKP